MNLDKKQFYYGVDNYKGGFSKNLVIYLYSKKSEDHKLNFQHILIKRFCEVQKVNAVKMYVDCSCKNNLDDKPNLKRMLNENNDTDIVIFSIDRLSRKIEDLIKINNICEEKNIRIYDLQNDEFLFEENEFIKSIKDAIKENSKKRKEVIQCKDI